MARFVGAFGGWEPRTDPARNVDARESDGPTGLTAFRWLSKLDAVDSRMQRAGSAARQELVSPEAMASMPVAVPGSDSGPALVSVPARVLPERYSAQ